ncbi:unnamed protein product [Ceutorhynchus assimilis]|uniref:Uncharacterized protein n=1 Tax=Ceutorhynchus assimilis TaxID=467358 RepID=A0A9P0DNH8_9CUCU|nr:unnamed protein product [Ceutorhynchus assimilis]
MTTYVQKKLRMFMKRPEWMRPERRRSESRLKTYPSSTDVRNWCDLVEDRRQHILELITRGYGEKCNPKLVPLDKLIEMLLAMANADLLTMKQDLDELRAFVDGLNLPESEMKKLKAFGVEGMRSEPSGDECDEKCAGRARRRQEEQEIGDVIKPTIRARMQSPGRMVTKIKGLPPGFEVIERPSDPGRMTIKMPKKSVEKMAEGVQVRLEDSGGDKAAAIEALCKEQHNKISELTEERDHLKTKLSACLRELDNFKKLQNVANPALPASCQEEIEALEAEIRIMRSGNPSPEEEAEIIRKEIEILKRYCNKLKDVEDENEKLKGELLASPMATKKPSEVQVENEKIREKLKNVDDLTKEKDMLANKVHMLEKRLLQYEDLPDDLEMMKNRSDMLEAVMEERDELNQKIAAMKAMEEELNILRAKADRVDELERELKMMSKEDRSKVVQYKKSQSITGNLEVELRNVKSERDAMQSRINLMKKQLDEQKAKIKEGDFVRVERDRLQIKLNELADIQDEYDSMTNKMRVYDNVEAERDMYKQKYEEVLDMECKCEMLKAQIDEARTVGREKEHLQKQVEDLQACICDQEDEIKELVTQVDNLARLKNNSNNQINTYKEEVAMKQRQLVQSKDQLAQSQTLSARIRDLEKLLHKAEHMLLQKDCHIKCLENQLTCTGKKPNQLDMDLMEQMRKELETARAENQRLQEIANAMMTASGDEHVKKMLKQSECAVKRVVEELGKQYKDWDHLKIRNPKGKFAEKKECSCYSSVVTTVKSSEWSWKSFKKKN